jgi:23S rRNA (cytosine1962-C5)-methyltransferase
VWEFSRSFPVLCRACRAILSERPLFVAITAYTRQSSPVDLYHALDEMMAGFRGSISAGELVTVEQSAGRVVPEAVFARWCSV